MFTVNSISDFRRSAPQHLSIRAFGLHCFRHGDGDKSFNKDASYMAAAAADNDDDLYPSRACTRCFMTMSSF